jgi:hypothetical protein
MRGSSPRTPGGNARVQQEWLPGSRWNALAFTVVDRLRTRLKRMHFRLKFNSAERPI